MTTIKACETRLARQFGDDVLLETMAGAVADFRGDWRADPVGYALSCGARAYGLPEDQAREQGFRAYRDAGGSIASLGNV